MSCDCYKKAFLPVIEMLERAASHMYFRTPDYDEHQQKIHEIVVSMNTKFRCIQNCYIQTKLEIHQESK